MIILSNLFAPDYYTDSGTKPVKVLKNDNLK